MFGRYAKPPINFGDENYKMKDKYQADQLVVANFQRISSKATGAMTPKVETTEQKYIFEVVVGNKKTRYREVFTGFIANDESEIFELPYVVNPEPFTKYFPEVAGRKIPKLSLIWAQNDINFSKEKAAKQLKR